MGTDRLRALLMIIGKIPMFSGLQAAHAKRVLSLCEFRSVEAGKTLFREGEPSDDMLILLSGRLRVSSADQVVLATIIPVAPVGEMGLITGQPRSANVDASEACTLLVLRKTAFDRLMRSHADICVRVYRSVIQTLSQRLRESDSQQRAALAEHAERERVLGQLQADLDATQRSG
jgi:CRP/FNR family transcriptional regulator, cyclic AMP receptor protein